jgi:hypothetical protein
MRAQVWLEPVAMALTPVSTSVSGSTSVLPQQRTPLFDMSAQVLLPVAMETT